MVLLQVEQPDKWAFWRYYSKAKKDECNQSNLSFLDGFNRFIPWTTGYFLDAYASVSLKLTTSGSIRGKQISKISTFEAIILKQNEGVRPQWFVFFDDFGTFSPVSNFMIFGSEWTCFTQNSYQRVFLGTNEFQNLIFWGYSKTKTEKCDHRILYFCVDFGIFVSRTTTDFLEASERVSSEVARSFC